MAVVYVTSDYGMLRRENGVLNYVNAEGKEQKILVHSLDVLVVSAKLTITGEAMQLLTREKINTVFVKPDGTYAGKLVFADDNHYLLHRQQYALCDNQAQNLEIARRIVLAKLTNELHFAQRINRKSLVKTEYDDVILKLKNLASHAESADNFDTLRGYEGAGAKAFFSVFRHNIEPEWAAFESRSTRPPLSNVNAVLSFLYTLLSYRVEIALETVGLDVYAGVFHLLGQRAKSLVYDLMEEFRTPIVDTLCCALFNLGVLSPNDFRHEGGEDTRKTAVFLVKTGINKVIAAFENKIATSLQYNGQEMTYNEIIIHQAELLKSIFSGEEKAYRGFVQK
jgi:CRISPR-associated protein Cas1